MSKYFNPANLSDLEEKLEKKAKKKREPKINKRKLTKAIKEIREEVERVQAGVSPRFKGALYLEGATPSLQCLSRLEVAPSVELAREFVDLAHEDFKARVGKYFKELIEETIT